MSESIIKLPGYEIPGYKIEREIGRGGMATVYLALQKSLRREVALKVMNPALSADEDFKGRFLNEGHIVGQLNHSNIVTVFDIGSHENHYYLSMEHLPAGSLRDRIEEGLSLERALSIAKTLGRALGYAHQRGFIHRDIKPPNVLFREDGSPVLTDFGIAKAIGASSQLTRTGYAFGSVGFMSPEQSLGKQIDHRSDIYSFGVMVWEMLTGRRLYESEDAFSLALKHATAPIPQLPPELQSLQPLLERLLAKQPDERYNRLEDFVTDLENLQQQTGSALKTISTDPTVVGSKDHQEPHTFVIPATTPQGSVGASQPPTRFRKGRVLATVLVLVIGAVVIGLVPGLNPFQRDSVLEQTAEKALPVESNSPLSTPVERSSPTTIEPAVAEVDTAGKVQQLLVQAEKQWRSGQFTAPSEDNAFDSYRQVMALDPNNQKARERLIEIGRMRLGDQYQERAQRLLDQNEPKQSLAEIEQGLRLAPGHDGLLELKKRVEEQLAATDIAALLAKAEQQWQRGQYTEPAGNNAYETYQRVLALEPDNSEARAGLIKLGRIRLVNQFHDNAVRLIAAGKLQQGLAEIEKGLRLAPEHDELVALHRQIQARLDDNGQ